MGLKQLIENNSKKVKRLSKLVDQVENYANYYASLDDEELKRETSRFKAALKDGLTLDDILPEAFAAIREADKRVLGLYPYRVQIMGGIVLHQGNLAEMRTGEGKTLTETLPVYLNALSGKGVHVITVNEYLSERDASEMGQVFEWMGLTVGINNSKSSQYDKKEAYNCDVTYSTNDELAFDYLRDNMCLFKNDQVQRGLNFAIVDEVDSILIDEARTPLIISGETKSFLALYKKSDQFVKGLTSEDYDYDLETKTIALLPSGVKKANKFFGISNLYDAEQFTLAHYVEAALKANYTMARDKDYVVTHDGEILIVDQFTGRTMPGRRFSDGLHQALEAKENVKINDANRTEANITYQNFFRMYNKLAGMSGTAYQENKEFYETYHMDVVSIPTNKPVQRIDMPDVLFPTIRSKYQAVIKQIEKVHSKGQPILVGTGSVEASEEISKMLKDKGIEHAVLNAKNNEKEAAIIKDAGQMNAITVATNMAGRGTDIKLGLGVAKLGGLFVLGTERHESSRIDDQLRGRAGRQGDPGCSVFFTSLEDELLERFGTDHIEKVRDELIEKGREFEPITNKLICKAVAQAQKRIEGNNFDERKNTLRYDDVLREQRNAIYSERAKVMDYEGTLDDRLIDMFARTININVDLFYQNEHPNYDGLFSFIGSVFGFDIDPEKLKKLNRYQIKEALLDLAKKELKNKTELLINPEQLIEFEKIIILKAVDANWKNNIDNMEQLRMSITLRGYGQYNPLVEYQRTAFSMYETMIADIEKDITKFFMKAEIRYAA